MRFAAAKRAPRRHDAMLRPAWPESMAVAREGRVESWAGARRGERALETDGEKGEGASQDLEERQHETAGNRG